MRATLPRFHYSPTARGLLRRDPRPDAVDAGQAVLAAIERGEPGWPVPEGMDALEAFERAAVAIALVDMNGRALRANTRLAELTGHSVSALEGVPFQLLTHPDDMQADFLQTHRLLEGEIDGYEVDKRYFHALGAFVWVRVSVSLVRDADGAAAYFVCRVDDIAMRKPLHRALEQERELSAAVLDVTPSLVVVLDPDGRIVRFNRACERATGRGRDEVRGERLWDVLTAPEHATEVREQIDGLLRGTGPSDFEARWVTRDGEPRLVACTTSALRDGSGRIEHLVCAGVDITEQREQETRLAHEAVHDTLTGLPNRALFTDRLENALERARRSGSSLAVMFLDVDGFKQVNDTLGHTAGDQLLNGFAERIAGVLRPADTVARFGGDEFTILCEDVDPDGTHASDVARRIEQALVESFDLGTAQIVVSTSIGIAIATAGDATADELVRNADAAMYRAKRRGPSNVELFDERMRARAGERQQLESELRRALERSEFHVYYQPQLPVGDGRAAGYEALLRWRHAERGVLAPSAFMELAEETGLIVPIGAWAFGEACRAAARVAGAPGVPTTMSVNVSARQFTQSDFVALVEQVLEESGLEPSRLCLELTEGVVMDRSPATLRRLEALKALGIRIAVDDFGIGTSSLTDLRHYPVDVLKLDRSFMADLDEDPRSAEVVGAIVGLAHSLGLTALAEGVERPAQLAALADVGCDLAQGYLFARPQPADIALARPRRAEPR